MAVPQDGQWIVWVSNTDIGAAPSHGLQPSHRRMARLQLLRMEGSVQLGKPLAGSTELVARDALGPRGKVVADPDAAVGLMIDPPAHRVVMRTAAGFPQLLANPDRIAPGFGRLDRIRPI